MARGIRDTEIGLADIMGLFVGRSREFANEHQRVLGNLSIGSGRLLEKDDGEYALHI